MTRRPSRLAAFTCAALMLGPPSWPVQAQQQLPALGDAAAEDLGVAAERRVGEQIMRQIRRDPDYLDDPLLLEYVQALWQPLVAQARAAGQVEPDIDQRFAWEAFLVRDRSVNAFALPGGYIGVHLGLIAITGTRDELASVLAHELTHVTQRHIARGVGNSRRQSILGLAAMIVGLIVASRSRSIDGANAAIAGGQAASIQGQLNFSREMEREADRIGFTLLDRAGFAPAGMAAMFERLDQGARLNDSNAFPYLRTHPLTIERVGEARARLGVEGGGRRATGSLVEHALAQARARVLMDNRVDALRRWQATEADRSGATPLERLSALASSALASSQLREHERAATALARADEALRTVAPDDTRAARAMALLKVQVALARGDAAQAAAALQPVAGDGTRPVQLAAAQIALAGHGGEAALRRAADDLQTRVAAAPMDATLWQTLGQLWTRLGQPLRALRAEGEAQYALGDLPGAIDRLRAGQRQARGGGPVDFIEASVIDARLRDIQAQWRALLAEQRGGPGEPGLP